MKNIKLLLAKEIKLAISPWTYLFFLCAGMLMIPTYPYWVGMFYCLMTIQINFSLARANNDNEFTASLPVKRSDVVLTKILSLTYIEIIQLIVAIPFAVLTTALNPVGNTAGMDANLAFFGFVIVGYGIFNLIFLTQYFKTGYKIGIFLMFAMLAYFLFAGVVEIILNLIPGAIVIFDGHSADTFIYRIATLIVCIGIYVLLMLWCFKKSAKNFEKVNL